MTRPSGSASVSATGQNTLGAPTSIEAPVVLAAVVPTTVLTTPLPRTVSDSPARLATMGAALVLIGAAAWHGSMRARPLE